MSKAQQAYVRFYCQRWAEAESLEVGQSVEIDMDEIADATSKGTPKPTFYVSEERQQTKLSCVSCGEFNDIIGRFGYCSVCGTRNDFAVFVHEIAPAIRQRLENDYPIENCLRDSVSAFDTLMSHYASRLAAHGAMKPSRKHTLERRPFASLDEEADAYRAWFDIDLRESVKPREWDDAIKGMLRRHLYEHNGGVVDEKYLQKSGDTSVRLGQRISETAAFVHGFLSTLVSISKRMHDGFHEIFPPAVAAIEAHKNKSARSKDLK